MIFKYLSFFIRKIALKRTIILILIIMFWRKYMICMYMYIFIFLLKFWLSNETLSSYKVLESCILYRFNVSNLLNYFLPPIITYIGWRPKHTYPSLFNIQIIHLTSIHKTHDKTRSWVLLWSSTMDAIH
jgi:hypothetical protein